MLHLVFDLQGTMAGFGDPSVGGQRRAATDLPRSAVLGLIHACMGIDRSQIQENHPAVAGIRLAIAQEAAGTMVDYHTVWTPKKGKTILTHRGYQTDLHATVAAWGDDDTLRRAHAALLRPSWTPYLGRRSCPLTAPMRPELVDAPTLAAAMEGRVADDARLHGDDHPQPGLERQAESLALDRPGATQGDRRTFAATPRHRYGGRQA